MSISKFFGILFVIGILFYSFYPSIMLFVSLTFFVLIAGWPGKK